MSGNKEDIMKKLCAFLLCVFGAFVCAFCTYSVLNIDINPSAPVNERLCMIFGSGALGSLFILSTIVLLSLALILAIPATLRERILRQHTSRSDRGN